jgi:hypothetical protein
MVRSCSEGVWSQLPAVRPLPEVIRIATTWPSAIVSQNEKACLKEEVMYDICLLNIDTVCIIAKHPLPAPVHACAAVKSRAESHCGALYVGKSAGTERIQK